MNQLLFFLGCFRRFMNQYFLLIACLQLWSLITPVNPASTWGPLIIIFAVSATKEAWDDYNRYLSDKQANEKEVWVVKNGVRKHVCLYLPTSSFFCYRIKYNG